eukprot:gnl/TRDRNA2_/TRDRNA2_138183_c0_seq4.p2 gnl/TRDRNA2_/TRDRNA2_138183_c0~~gnl/TRDRNA2_/TRDRNA2_138183_c0_seq4.p2  ORF type:complete len:103 (-),score=5.46 gnl/TRDRNA2_/TRDRNA2_138183_c0_seq4:325-633(-)
MLLTSYALSETACSSTCLAIPSNSRASDLATFAKAQAALTTIGTVNSGSSLSRALAMAVNSPSLNYPPFARDHAMLASSITLNSQNLLSVQCLKAANSSGVA